MVWVRLSSSKIFLVLNRTFDPFLFHLIVHLNTEDVDIVEEKVPGNEEIAGNSNISSPDFETKGQDYFLHELFNWLAARLKKTTTKTETMKTITHNPSNKWECAWRNRR